MIACANSEIKKIASHWVQLEGANFSHLSGGLINQTYLVCSQDGQSFVLQRLNPIFGAHANLDFVAMTTHLNQREFVAPRLLPTGQGELWVEVEGACWRLMTHLSGQVVHRVTSKEQAFSAGRLVGQFHLAVSDFNYDYRFKRSNVHNTALHLSLLRDALQAHDDWAQQLQPLGEQILKAGERVGHFDHLTGHHCHGDLKISNMLFAQDGTAHYLLDFDTIGMLPLPIELADAFRSWCNPKGEDVTDAVFDMVLFEAALLGYFSVARPLWTRADLQALPAAISALPLELSSRFLRDAILDQYFGYDPTRFASRKIHNHVRSLGQWSLHLDIEKKRPLIMEALQRIAFA